MYSSETNRYTPPVDVEAYFRENDIEPPAPERLYPWLFVQPHHIFGMNGLPPPLPPLLPSPPIFGMNTPPSSPPPDMYPLLPPPPSPAYSLPPSPPGYPLPSPPPPEMYPLLPPPPSSPIFGMNTPTSSSDTEDEDIFEINDVPRGQVSDYDADTVIVISSDAGDDIAVLEDLPEDDDVVVACEEVPPRRSVICWAPKAH